MKLHLHQRIVLFTFLILVNLPSFTAAQPPSIICPGATITLDDTGTNDANFWNGGGWLDPVVNNNNLAERTTLLEFSGTDHCSDSGTLTFRYVISFDLNQDNVFETFVDSDSLPGRDSIYFGNSPTNLSSGTVRHFDHRQVSGGQKWGFGLKVTPNGGSRKARVIWQNDAGAITDPEIPYGTHKIKWIVTDSCGVSSTCEYGFTIKDAQKPAVACLNGLSVNIPFFPGNNGNLQLWATDFLQYTEDNYTPAFQLTLGIRRTGTGIGFPYNPDGTPQTSVQFNCADLGTQLVELWSKDKAGNTNHCDTYVLIQDNLGYCSDPPGSMSSGRITTPTTQEGIADVNLEISGMSSGIPTVSIVGTTDETGEFTLPNPYPLPISTNTLLVPVLDIDPLNGVNTFDLILISRHILGLEPLNTPYKLISADVNKSGTLTTFDVVELRKLILGTYTELPNNKSWRFVDKTQNFADPNNPFAETIRESINISQANWLPMDFIGCKIGDVDDTAIPNFQGETEDRNYDMKVMTLKNRLVQAGDKFTVHFETPEDASGLQMTLGSKGLQLEKIIPQTNCSKDNFGLFSQIQNAGSSSVFTAVFENGAVGFDAVFTALQDGTLDNMLEINSNITKSMAFDQAGRRYDLALRFEAENEKMDQPVFFQNNPNPWSHETRLAFYLPENGKVNINVTGQNGQVVYQQNGQFAEGYHQIVFEKDQFPASGVYYVRLQTGVFSEVRKMMFYKNN